MCLGEKTLSGTWNLPGPFALNLSRSELRVCLGQFGFPNRPTWGGGDLLWHHRKIPADTWWTQTEAWGARGQMALTREAGGHSSRILLHCCESQGFLFFQFSLPAASSYSQTSSGSSTCQGLGPGSSCPQTFCSMCEAAVPAVPSSNNVPGINGSNTVHLPKVTD